MESLLKTLKQNGELLINEPIKRHTSFRIGGTVEYFIKPKNVFNLKQCLLLAASHNIPVTVIGRGTNLLVKDSGIPGLVIKLGKEFDYIYISKETVIVGASSSLPAVAIKTMQSGLKGLEWAIGIPGSVGGAVVMNAGAHGYSVSEVVKYIKILSYTGEILEFSRDQMDFCYRGSIIKDRELGIILEAVFELKSENKYLIKERMKKYIAKRRIMQPRGYPNAGSIFKNPTGDSAGRLIELAGCKGLKVGNAVVSEKHANWIINLGGASFEDVMTLIDIIKSRVKNKFDIYLQLEVRVLG